jgi:undecaprenyl-diphosphatase
MIRDLIAFDGNILIYIQDFVRMSFLTPIFKAITHLGNDGLIWIVIAIVLLCFKKTRKVGVLTLIALLLSLIVDNVILKNVVARIRPYEVIDGLQILIEKPKDYSFPSGHTGSAFAAAIVLVQMLPKKYGYPMVVLATLMGFSRLYVGVHYPSDVICGAIIGTVIGIVVYRMYMRYEQRDANKKLVGYSSVREK